MNTLHFKAMRLWGRPLLGLALALLCVPQPQLQAKQKIPIWPKVAVVPFTIDPQHVEGAAARADQDALAGALVEEATKRAERLLLLRHVGSTVERVTSPQNTAAPAVLTGTVSLPLSLPPGVIGWKARARKGAFVTARARLVDAAGQVLAEEQVTLNWGDVWWLGGGRGKAKAQLPLDKVLRKFTRKSVDQAIEGLQRKVHNRRLHDHRVGVGGNKD